MFNNILKEHIVSIFTAVRNRVFRNFGNHLPEYPVSNPRPENEFSLPLKPDVLQYSHRLRSMVNTVSTASSQTDLNQVISQVQIRH
jgi:hypothetical protein